MAFDTILAKSSKLAERRQAERTLIDGLTRNEWTACNSTFAFYSVRTTNGVSCVE